MKRRVSFVLSLALAAFLLHTDPAFAIGGCNGIGCWNKLAEVIKVSDDGKIWFVVDNSEDLDILDTEGFCTLRNIWTGQAERALFIAVDDPSRDEKYKVLLASQTLGTRIGFNPELDPTSGWCRLGAVSLGAT